MSKDEYLITDAPLKALTVFAIDVYKRQGKLNVVFHTSRAALSASILE